MPGEQTLDEPATTSALDAMLIDRLEEAFDKPTQAVVVHDLAKIAVEHSSVDLAIAASRLPPHARAVLFTHLRSSQEKIQFLINTDSGSRLAVLREVSDEEVILLIGQMPPDEAVRVLEDLPERRYRRVIGGLEPTKAARILEIEKNARNTAGRLMTNEFFAFSMDATIEEVSLSIRNNPGIDLTSRIFVLGSEGELLGYIPARNLIVNASHLHLKKVMRPILHKATADMPREEIVDVVERYKISALPVVNEDQRLIGVITYEDVIDALEDLLDETIGSVAGTNEKISENESAFKKFLSRSPWLFVTLFAGLVNVGVMSTFDSLEKGMLAFALFFVPLITGMSGNIGIQCSTVLVRSMAMGMMTKGHRRGVIFRELFMGIMAAAFFGCLCGFMIHVIDFAGIPVLATPAWSVGLVVGVGLFGACLTGTLLGVSAPFFFARVGVDPAVASGPIVTAFNDFLSMVIYFLISLGMGKLLF